MSRIESRIKELTARLSQWWGSAGKTRAQRAASRVQDFRESDRGQRKGSPAKRATPVGTATFEWR